MTQLSPLKTTGASGTSATGFDTQVLAQLLAIGGDSLRADLCAQLEADFKRLRAELLSLEGSALGRSAHETKGLAATVGAVRLAEMARTLDGVAATLLPAAREVMVQAVVREIDVVLTKVSDAAKGS